MRANLILHRNRLATGGAASLDCGDLSPLWAMEACRRHGGCTTPRLFGAKRGATRCLFRPRADNRSEAQVASRRLPAGQAQRGKSAPPQSGDKSPQSKALRASPFFARDIDQSFRHSLRGRHSEFA